ncbi:MAG: hypothetical protein V8R52_01005 [Coprobacter fastidiosus]
MVRVENLLHQDILMQYTSKRVKILVIGKLSASLNQATVATCLTLEVAVVQTP